MHHNSYPVAHNPQYSNIPTPRTITYDPLIDLPDGSFRYLSDIKQCNDITNTLKAYKRNTEEYSEQIDRAYIQSDISAQPIFTSINSRIVDTEILKKNLCSSISNAIAALTYNTGTDFLSGLIMILSQVLTALQGNIRFNIKDDWHEYPSLYVIGTAPPGSRKSQIISRLLVPFDNFSTTLAENTLSDDVGKELKRHLKTEVKEQVRLILNTSKNSTDRDIGNTTNEKLLELSRQRAQLNNSILSSPKIFTLEDCTYPGFIAALENNDGHIAVTSAEGGIISDLIKDSKILECFKRGYGFEKISRRTSSKYTQIAFPSLQLLLYVQPSETLRILNNNKMQEQGLTARFIFLPEYVSKEHTPQYSKLDLNEYNKKIYFLLELFHCTKGNRNIRTIYASPQAVAALTDFEREIGNILPQMPEKSHPALRKLHGIVARLALAYHFWQNPSPLESEISVYSTQIGVDIARALIPRLYEVYHEYGLVAQPMAEKIVNYILSFDSLQRQETLTKDLELSHIAKGIRQKAAEVEKGLTHLHIRNALYLYRTASGKCKVILHRNFFHHFDPILYTPHYQSLR